MQIIDDNVKADELCTRREYARWLVLVNSRLERYRLLHAFGLNLFYKIEYKYSSSSSGIFSGFRSPKNRIVPSIALSGSITNAFDDVRSDDPDFEYIQGNIGNWRWRWWYYMPYFFLQNIKNTYLVLNIYSSAGRGWRSSEQAVR